VEKFLIDLQTPFDMMRQIGNENKGVCPEGDYVLKI